MTSLQGDVRQLCVCGYIVICSIVVHSVFFPVLQVIIYSVSLGLFSSLICFVYDSHIEMYFIFVILWTERCHVFGHFLRTVASVGLCFNWKLDGLTNQALSADCACVLMTRISKPPKNVVPKCVCAREYV